jgi:hypothetical protein
MLHQNALLTARVYKLKEQLAVVTKRKSRKRKRIQQGCHGWTTHTQRVLVVFNKFDTGRSLVLSGSRK